MREPQRTFVGNDSSLQQTFEAVVIELNANGLFANVEAHPGVTTRLGQLADACAYVFVVSDANVDRVTQVFQPSELARDRLFVYGGVADKTKRASALTRVMRCRFDGYKSGSPANAATPPDECLQAAFGATVVEWLLGEGISGELVLWCHDAAGGPGVSLPPRVRRLKMARVDGASTSRDDVQRRSAPSLLELLEGQLKRRAQRRVPVVDRDPAWTIALPSGSRAQRVAESLGALGNGMASVRAALEETTGNGAPGFFVMGAYDRDDRLVAAPEWIGLHFDVKVPMQQTRQLLDLRCGLLAAEEPDASSFRSIRFVSMSRPHVLALRAEAAAPFLEPGWVHRTPGAQFFAAEPDGAEVAQSGSPPKVVDVAIRDRTSTDGTRRFIERLGSWSSAPSPRSAREAVLGHLEQAEELGFDLLLLEHRAAWARRWSRATVEIGGAPSDQLAARFAVFHLLSSACDLAGEAAVGARGLTGDAYGGHVFWDADVYVLPALMALDPRAARAMLEYRIRRLDMARELARQRGHLGARFPWESAADGRDVTPQQARGSHGEVIAIETGRHEEHVVADVAWSAKRYAEWTADPDLFDGAGRALLVDTARYWASRVEFGEDQCAHLYEVMGPDEYHEIVNDNAYTNVMARMNLRAGAHLLATSPSRADRREALSLRRTAAVLVDGWRPDLGIYEQFEGYLDLEPLIVAEIAQPPIALDVLLGKERVARSQLIKQADVVLLHHLVPEETEIASLPACLSFYEPRTAHGSSLSPAISASLHAQVGLTDRALELFRIAARLDLDDLTATSAGGLHLATMGGLWQALAFGFLGLRQHRNVLVVAPHLPEAWSHLTLGFHFRGRQVQVRAEHDRVFVRSEPPVSVRVGAGGVLRCGPRGQWIPIAYEAQARRR